MGMLAAMLGRPRDSYYRELSSINLRVGLRILTPLKKTFHRVNHLKVENSSDFQGAKGHTQTPFEVVTGMDIRTDFVCYRLYLSAASDSDTARTTMDEIERNLHMESGTYPLTLGTANFTAQVQGFRIFMENDWHERPAPMDFMSLHSAIFSERVLAIDTRSNSKLLAEEELLPADFVDNYNRELSGMHRLFFAIDGQPLPLKISGNYIELHNADEETENIVFLD
jgi:CRISPR-associated protein Cas5h